MAMNEDAMGSPCDGRPVGSPEAAMPEPVPTTCPIEHAVHSWGDEGYDVTDALVELDKLKRGVAAAVQEAFQDGFDKGESHAEKSIPVIDEAVKAAEEQCCKLMCGNCQQGIPMNKEYEDGHTAHVNCLPCLAAPIRRSAAIPGKEPAIDALGGPCKTCGGKRRVLMPVERMAPLTSGYMPCPDCTGKADDTYVGRCGGLQCGTTIFQPTSDPRADFCCHCGAKMIWGPCTGKDGG